MKIKIKINKILLLLAGITAMISCRKDATFLPVNIIPEPVSVEEQGGYFEISPSTKILVPGDNDDIQDIAGMFAQRMATVSGFTLPTEKIKDKRNDHGIIFKLLPGADTLGDEGYLLKVKRKNVELSAYRPAGLFRGLQTIYQLLPPEVYGDKPVKNIKWRMPRVNIYDKPEYSWRGMHLDVSRHFFPKEFIKRYIDLIAMHKMNVFHWHLTDDNGWRIEIDKYPKLTEIAAWHVDRSDEPWREVTPPKPGEKATYGGFYTKDDIREIVQYAADRYITILPEIEMPGHTSEVLAAYPELSCTGGPFYVQPGSYWPNVAIFCAGNDETFEFLENVLDEIIELFPGEYIHIGGDEATKTNWKHCKKCQKRIKDEGLKDENELQSWFVKKIEKYLISKGKRLIGWDEILEGGLAPEATVMSWRGFEGGIESARQGHDVVMSPTSHCYFDYYQANPDFEPEAIGGFTTLKKVYSFEPTPPVLNADEAKHILGGQGNVWTEFIATPEHAEYMSVPRMTALAEVLWTPKEKRNWPDFRKRLEEQFKRFDAMGVNYSKGSFAVEFITEDDKANNRFIVKMETEQLNPVIHYTLDGTVPDTTSPVYDQPLEIDTTSTIRAAIFVDGKMKETFSERTIVFHKALGAAVKYKNKPDFRYPGQGEITLIDGLKGSKNHRDGYWQGFEGDDLDVVVDLGKVEEIHRVSATFYQRQKSWIFLPVRFMVSYSEDGKNFSRIKSTANDVSPKKDGNFIKEFAVDFVNAKARYLKIKATNLGVCPEWHRGAGGKAWLFVDEIVVE